MATISLGFYLWKRIREVGISSIMGLPGDFQLELLDYIYDVPGLQWMGNANELNSAYAADGYSRAKGIPGCLVTTHGVGELSAINGVAGAHAEQVKLIHVVGQTTRPMQKRNMMIHHSIGFDPDHRVYAKMSEPTRCAAVELAEITDLEKATWEIDRVIRECFVQSFPVYIFIPLDMVHEQVAASLLDTKIDLSMPSDSHAEAEAIDATIEALQEAKSPTAFIDVLAHRHNAKADAQAVLQKLNVPVSSSVMGKSIYDETLPNWIGVYNGVVGAAGTKNVMEHSDLVLVIGSLPSDTNTGGFSRKLSKENSIEVNPQSVIVKGRTFPNIWMKPFLKRLLSSLSSITISAPSSDHTLANGIHTDDNAATHITQAWIWSRLSAWFRSGDFLFADTGTAAFGFTDYPFPSKFSFQTQNYYGSIGWATPAALGCAAALQELAHETGQSTGRTLLITGDGSFQLTMAEVGTMITRRLRVTIMVINNAGYTIERAIHGAHQSYNDISPYNFRYTLQLFGMPDDQAEKSFRRVSTKEELEKVLGDTGFEEQEGVKMVEVVMDKIDAPARLLEQIATRGEKQINKMKEAGFLK
ncbi:pyruvate decarboxylase [Viridothelium virens]|uniref:Pyruvate decarboxylase n=1 Tax=Viridothelium virens TaxID=1048519 RepID=A0A6A6GVQ9_VIRVR|nr:pyruvate decarboxylase [Viridothelium virens]